MSIQNIQVKHALYGIGEGEVYYNAKNVAVIKVKFADNTITFDYQFSFFNKVLELVNSNQNLVIPIVPPVQTNKINISTKVNNPFTGLGKVIVTPKPKKKLKNPVVNKKVSPDLTSILKDYIEDFKRKKDWSFVVKDSIPIVWFGDIDAYFTSNLKVVTIGLNPSDQEFSSKRFDIIDFDNGNIDSQIDQLKETLCNYFKDNPYWKWFNKYEKLLDAKNCSYGNNKGNTAIHIDLMTAIATNPTWGGLEPNEKARIQNIPLFEKLLAILNPDFVLCSVNQDAFNVTFKNILTLKKDFLFGVKNHIKVYEDSSGKIFLNGTNMQGIPFGAIYEKLCEIVIAKPDADGTNCKYYISKQCGGDIQICEDYC